MAAVKPKPAQGIDGVDQELRDKLQVVPVSEVVEWINLFDYGEPGAGKTHLLGTAADDPRLFPLLIFDVEGGMMTLRNKPGIDVIKVRSMDEVESKYNTLYHSIKTDPKTGKQSIYYKTIGLDSLTELADLDMRSVMRAAYQRKPESVDIDVPSPREWGIVRNHIRLITRAFKDLPCHFICTGGLGIDSPEGEPSKYRPAFAGKLIREVPGFFDIVGYYRAKNRGGEITRILQVTGTDRVLAKDRTQVLGQSVENPTLSSIWDMIEGVKLAPEQERASES
jgi:AAA domain